VLLVTIVEAKVPYVRGDEMAQVEELGPGFKRLTASFGFMQRPDVMQILKSVPKEKLQLDWDELVVYLPEACLVTKGDWWRQRVQWIYNFLWRNSLPAWRYFGVPPREVIHIGVRLEV
jgi:KUP system potassium uptake protein